MKNQVLYDALEALGHKLKRHEDGRVVYFDYEGHGGPQCETCDEVYICEHCWYPEQHTSLPGCKPHRRQFAGFAKDTFAISWERMVFCACLVNESDQSVFNLVDACHALGVPNAPLVRGH